MNRTLRVVPCLLAVALLACDEAGPTDPAIARCDPEVARADRDTDEDLARCFGAGFSLQSDSSRVD